MSEEVDDEIKRTPAEENPWYRFIVESIALDIQNGKDRGWHWFWGIYCLRNEMTQLPKLNIETIKKALPDGHWLKEIDNSDINKDTSDSSHKPLDDSLKKTALLSLRSFLGELIDIDSNARPRIDFSRLFFEDHCNFSYLIFPIDTSFIETKFSASGNFMGAVFYDTVDFDSAVFSSDAYFENAIFIDNTKFTRTKFSTHAYFDNTAFSRNVLFSEAKFCSSANFIEAKFILRALFNNVKFSDDTLFIRATFSSPTEFDDIVFLGRAYFSDAKFLKGVTFTKTTFSKDADFTDTLFKSTGNFTHVIFSGLTRFDRAELQSSNFAYAKFEKLAPHFFDAKIGGDVIWERNIEFWAQPQKKSNEKINEIFRLNQNAYENLSYHMEKLGKYHDQHFFFRQEMRCRKQLGSVFNYVIYGLYEIFANYGYGVGNAFSWWLANICLWAGVLYSVAYLNHFKTFFDDFSCAFGVSLANAHGFFFMGGRLSECYKVFEELPFFTGIWVTQIILGIPLLFLLGLTLRVRFRLK